MPAKKCNGSKYVLYGTSFGIGWLMTSRWILYKDQPVPLYADYLNFGVALTAVGYGLYKLKTKCKTQKKSKLSLLTIIVPAGGLITYAALNSVGYLGGRIK